jgi:hypothetical protein
MRAGDDELVTQPVDGPGTISPAAGLAGTRRRQNIRKCYPCPEVAGSACPEQLARLLVSAGGLAVGDPQRGGLPLCPARSRRILRPRRGTCRAAGTPGRHLRGYFQCNST